jgi:hypothetical protein
MSESTPDGDKEAPADPGGTNKLPRFATSIDMSAARQAIAASNAMMEQVGGARKLLDTCRSPLAHTRASLTRRRCTRTS